MPRGDACGIPTLKNLMLIIQEQKEDHTLLHLACEQMVYGVTQTQEKKLDPRMNDAQGLDNP